MNLFTAVAEAPADPILGLSESFRADPRPHKIDLTVGIYQDEQGENVVFEAIRAAAQRLTASERTKAYLPMTGAPDFLRAAVELLWPDEAGAHAGARVSAQTPGGTGALRLAADFIRECIGPRTVWISNPTWANHKAIFAAAGMDAAFYRYYHTASHTLDLEGLMENLQEANAGDLVVLHASCHNPTGCDLAPEQWQQLAALLEARGLIPVLDMAYQGLAQGLAEDRLPLQTLEATGLPVFVCQSFSKTFGLYRERVGALHILTPSPDEARRVGSQLKRRIRTNWSNPPAHGALALAEVWRDPQLRDTWAAELDRMRFRLSSTREALASQLARHGLSDLGYLRERYGMFVLLPLTREQVHRLREDHAIYLVESGRINITGLNPDNLERFVEAFAALTNANPTLSV